MRKLHILFATLCLVLAGACSSDDILEQTPETPETPDTPQAKGQRITIRASVDDAMGTKAGVVENNTDYKAGETFYWSNGDQIKLFFVQVVNGKEYFDYWNPIPTALFTAESAADEAADFTGYIPDGLPDGTYNICASSPKMEQYSFYMDEKAPLEYDWSFLSSLQQHQTQAGKSSQGLYTDGNMELWGRAVEGVEIEDGKLKNPMQNLSYEMVQLNAMLRFTITNTMDKAMTVKKISVTTKKGSDDINTFFSYSANLNYSSGAECWSVTYATRWSTMSLTIEPNEEEEATIGKGKTFDAYVCVLPSDGVLADGGALVVDVLLKAANGKEYLRQGKITSTTPGFSFLFKKDEGLQAGARYYFDIALTEDKIDPVTYKVGDLYPRVGVPEGIVFEVNEAGTIGKMVSLDESTGKTWGADGKIGIISWIDGEGNTVTIIDIIEAAAEGEDLRGTYPAFEWCANKGDGWYLPAISEMMDAYWKKETLNPILEEEDTATPLSNTKYWTSTAFYNNDYHDEDETKADVIDFSDGIAKEELRSETLYVRAMKKFDVTK